MAVRVSVWRWGLWEVVGLGWAVRAEPLRLNLGDFVRDQRHIQTRMFPPPSFMADCVTLTSHFIIAALIQEQTNLAPLAPKT